MRKPVDDRVLLARIRSLLRGGGLYEMAREFEDLGFAEPEPAFALPARIFLIAQSAHTAVTWRHRIGAQMRDPVSVLSPGAVLDGAATSPDLFVIEADPSRTQCLQLVSELRSRRDSRHAAICLVVNDASGVDLATALDIGADDAVAEGFDGAEIALRARALIRRKRHADGQRARVTEGLRLALADPLTGLSNRRHAMPVLARMITAARLSQSRCAVMILDLDRFKSVNDRYGHATGDSVLTEAAQRLASLCRPSDLVARIGGEEFLIARSGVDEPAAFAFAQGLRSAISERPMAGQDPGHSLDLAVTASIGLALTDFTDEPAEAVLARADMALLAAKRDGRDLVSIGRGLSAA